MRLLKFATGIAAVAIGFGVFAWTSAPRDKSPALSPYVVSERAGFYSMNNVTIGGITSPHVFAIKYQVHDLTTGEAQLLIASTPRKPGSGYSMELAPDLEGWRLFARKTGGKTVVTPPMDTVQSITLWRQLKWNEILWARLTHLGRDPFPPMYPQQQSAFVRH